MKTVYSTPTEAPSPSGFTLGYPASDNDNDQFNFHNHIVNDSIDWEDRKKVLLESTFGATAYKNLSGLTAFSDVMTHLPRGDHSALMNLADKFNNSLSDEERDRYRILEAEEALVALRKKQQEIRSGNGPRGLADFGYFYYVPLRNKDTGLEVFTCGELANWEDIKNDSLKIAEEKAVKDPSFNKGAEFRGPLITHPDAPEGEVARVYTKSPLYAGPKMCAILNGQAYYHDYGKCPPYRSCRKVEERRKESGKSQSGKMERGVVVKNNFNPEALKTKMANLFYEVRV